MESYGCLGAELTQKIIKSSDSFSDSEISDESDRACSLLKMNKFCSILYSDSVMQCNQE